MENQGEFTRAEILSQPEAWQAACGCTGEQQAAITSLFQAGNYNQVVFTGCGSTYYLSLAAAAVFQDLSGRAGRVSRPPSCGCTRARRMPL